MRFMTLWSTRRLIVSVAVFLTAFAPFGLDAARAEKPAEIGVAVITDLTGPYAAVVGPAGHGAEDAVKYVNDELNGVDGVKMTVTVKDSTGNPALGVRQYTELVAGSPKPLCVIAPLSPIATLLREKAKTDGVILFVPSATENLYPPANSYGYFALYVNQAATAVRWVKDNWKEPRNPKIAIVTWDTPFGKAIISQEFFDYCKDIGVEIVSEEFFGVGEKDLISHMIRVRAKKPDWILTNTLGPGPVAIMKAVKELNMDTKLLNGTAGDMGTIALDPSLFEDCISVLTAVSYDDDANPGMKILKEYQKKFGRAAKDETMPYVVAWQSVLLMRHVIKEAVDKVGWDKLNVEAVMGGLNRVTDWELLNGVARVTYTEKMRDTPWVIINKVKNGKLLPAGGVGGDGSFVRVPDIRPKQFR